MELVEETQLDLRRASLICRQSSIVPLLAAAVLLGAVAALLEWYRSGGLPAVFAWCSAPLLLGVAAIALYQLVRSLRASNWLVAVMPTGLAVKLTSYLRDDFVEGPRVLVLTDDEIRKAGRLDERIKSEQPGGGDRVYDSTFLVLDLEPELGPLRERLHALRKHTSKTRIHHYPVTIDRAGLVRVCWRSKSDVIRPKVGRLLEALEGRVRIDEARRVRMDLTAPMADDDRVIQLVESGQTIEAVRLCKRSMGMTTADAKAFVDELRA